MSKVGNEILVLVAAVLFALFTFPANYMAATSVIAVIIYIMSKSVAATAGVFIGIAVLRLLMTSPTGAQSLPASEVKRSMYTDQQREGFQPKDPISIHQRIEKEKNGAPLKPAGNVITGVLESPNILDSLQISAVHPVEHGGSASTRPASIHAPEIIPTPPELTPSSSSSVEAVPISNPVLQNGHDHEGILTALVAKGTALFKGHPSTEVHGASKSGPAAP